MNAVLRGGEGPAVAAANRASMRSPSLHAALRPYVEEAAWELAQQAGHGDEIGFDLVEERAGHRPPLYLYRPQVDRFVAGRLGDLARLPSYAVAVRALSEHDGLDRYLRANGSEPPRERPVLVRAALRVVLTRALGDLGDIAFDEARFRSAYEELERHVLAGRVDAVVVVPVLGLDVESDELALSDDFVLARGEALADQAPAEATWPLGADAPALLAVHRSEGEGADALAAAGVAFRRLLVALRLWDDGDVRLGPQAWTRADGGTWRALPLAAPGPPPREVSLVGAEHEDALRAFCALVQRRTPRGGPLAWALARHEVACERPPREALTDVLLALRVLLEPEGRGAGDPGTLARRLAALCAPAEGREDLRRRVEDALELERHVVVGTASAGGEALGLVVLELRSHLRALLRDVLCGHLDSDLAALADRLAAEQPTLT